MLNFMMLQHHCVAAPAVAAFLAVLKWMPHACMRSHAELAGHKIFHNRQGMRSTPSIVSSL